MARWEVQTGTRVAVLSLRITDEEAANQVFVAVSPGFDDLPLIVALKETPDIDRGAGQCGRGEHAGPRERMGFKVTGVGR